MLWEVVIMPPTVSVAAFVFGVVLLLAAIIGRDIKIVAVEIPSLTGNTRIAVGLFGVLLLFAGLFDIPGRPSPNTGANPTVSVASALSPSPANSPIPGAANPVFTSTVPVPATAGPNSLSTPTVPSAALGTTASSSTSQADQGPPTDLPCDAPQPLGDTPYDEPGAELANAFRCKYKGTTVSIEGPFTPESEDGKRLQATLKYFQEKTGITIVYTGTDEFESLITQKVENGQVADIADFPQPGLLKELAASGKVIDINTVVDPAWLQKNYKWLNNEAQMPGPNGQIQAGVWWRVNYKSLVWYPRKAFDAAGYRVPQTWNDMTNLMKQMVADKRTPWCIGIEDGNSTGWPATDWMEDIMLRTTSPQQYDAWVNNQLPFTSPEVRNAAMIMSDIWLNKDYVYGGRGAIVGTNFQQAPAPMFDDPPKCWLHRQSSFITGFFPAGKGFGTDYDVFYLPPINAENQKPVLFAGDIMAMFNDRAEVRAVIQYMTLGESISVWLGQGGVFAPHIDIRQGWYSSAVDRKVADIVRDATVYKFDASDAMPKRVGQGTFWKAMRDFVAGSLSIDEALAEIQKGW
jgi:alpha-glucoside transport system substrate-binding protein